ncbi:hypothetical protein GQ457_03G009670 [Hibiscus cannabinus]
MIILYLNFAFDLGLQSVIAEGDNKYVILKLNSTKTYLSVIGPIIRDVKLFGLSFNSYHFNFIGRNGNNPAHALATEEMRHSIDRFWVEDAPNLVRILVDQDRRFLEPS